MLKSMSIRNLTVFPEAILTFGRHLNVVIGENGAGKSHLLKTACSILAVSAEEGRKPNSTQPTKGAMQAKLAGKLFNVFRPESLGRLARRRHGHERCDIEIVFDDPAFDINFGFSTKSKSEVVVERLPSQWLDTAPAFLPTRELLTIFPNFVSIYEGHYLEFEETWRDTCVLLGALLQRGQKEKRIRKLLAPLEEAMGGSIELDKNGCFYLQNASGQMEMPIVNKRLQNLEIWARLIVTGKPLTLYVKPCHSLTRE